MTVFILFHEYIKDTILYVTRPTQSLTKTNKQIEQNPPKEYLGIKEMLDEVLQQTHVMVGAIF